MDLEAGLYLASGVGDGPGKPCFAEIVAPQEEREAQWRRIVTARVNNIQCDVFKSFAAYTAFSLQIRSHPGRN
jgi:hypothetical protein